jgi:HK97 family phage major capsid protein
MRRDDILALKEQRHSLITEMQKLFTDAETRGGMVAEERETYDKLEEEFRSVTERWQTAEELYNREQEVKKALDTPIELRASLDADEVPETLTEWREKHRDPRPQDTAEYRSAWFHYMSAAREHDLDIEEKRVLSKASAGAGANLVPTSFRNEIVNIARHMGPINELAQTITTDSGETMQVPSVSAHGTASWTAENAAYSPSDETFGQVSLGAFKAGTKVIVSEELLQDASFGLERYLAQEFGERIGVLEETAYAVGDGSGKPLGIAHASSGVSTSVAPTGNTTSISYAAMLQFAFALPFQYRRNAVWVFADSAVRQLYTMADGNSRPLWQVNVANTGPDTFLGYPIYTSPDLSTLAANARFGIFGDIRRGYMIRRVNGFTMQRQDELHSDNGQIGFRGYERVDGRVVLADAMRVLVASAT